MQAYKKRINYCYTIYLYPGSTGTTGGYFVGKGGERHNLYKKTTRK